MLTHWNKLINTDCAVVKIGEHYVYPIFRNASTSLFDAADATLVNTKIKKCKDIHIFLRDPEHRFISGINEYCLQNNLEVEKTWHEVWEGKLIDRHFAPQWLWLLHLYKYYKGDVVIKPFVSINNYCKVHAHKTKIKKEAVALLHDFVAVDYELLKHTNEKIKLEFLIKEYKNVLSKT